MLKRLWLIVFSKLLFHTNIIIIIIMIRDLVLYLIHGLFVLKITNANINVMIVTTY